MKKFVVIAGAAAVLSFGTMTLPAAAQAQSIINVQYGPPPPARVEVVPGPRRGRIWSPGHYEWRGHRHVWVRVVWLRARPGYAYRAPEWRENNGRWEYRRGAWDRDGDGVPNRVDRAPNDPTRH